VAEAVVWGVGRESAFVEYLCADLSRTLGDRSALEQKWARWLDQYRAPVTSAVKDFPWHGASNLTLPLTAMNADPLIARFMTTMHAPPYLWTMQPLNERWVDVSKPMQDYLQFLDGRHLHMYDVNYRAVLEFIKLGTCIYKTGWAFERRKKMSYGADGKIERTLEVISHPFVDHVSLVDFVMPPESYHIQPDQQGGAPWVAERFFLRLGEFLARAQGQEPFLPDYDPEAVKKVAHFADAMRSTQGPVEDTRYRLDDYQPSDLRRIELFECHCRFDTQGTGFVDDVVGILHLPSRTLLRATLNPYRHGARPYSVARYLRGDGFYGIGECEQSEVFQTALTTLTNYQMDNVLAVNAPMLGVKFGANVVPNEPIYPLKIWALDDPANDIREIKLSEVYPSLPQFGAILQGWCERRTGLNDLNTTGNPASVPSRTPATSLLSMLQEGNRRFDLSLKELRAALDEVGLRTLQNLQQFLSEPFQNPGAVTTLRMAIMALGEPEGTYVATTLTTPLEDIESGVGVTVTATSGSMNKEVEKQNFMGLLQLQATMFMPMYLQLAQILSNPQVQLLGPAVMQTAAQLFKGTSELQQRLYEQFDIRNTEEMVVNTAVILDTVAQSAPFTAALAFGAQQAILAEQRKPGPANGGDGGGTRKPPEVDPNSGLALLLGAR